MAVQTVDFRFNLFLQLSCLLSPLIQDTINFRVPDGLRLSADQCFQEKPKNLSVDLIVPKLLAKKYRSSNLLWINDTM